MKITDEMVQVALDDLASPSSEYAWLRTTAPSVQPDRSAVLAEAAIDELRFKAFKTNSDVDRQAYFDATSKWFQDRHYRDMDAASALQDGPVAPAVDLEEVRKAEFSRGYVIACCNLINMHGTNTYSIDTFTQIGITQDEIAEMDLSEYDLEALADLEGMYGLENMYPGSAAPARIRGTDHDG